jgi:hypothetical protein
MKWVMPRWKISTLLVAMVMIALVLALVAQQNAADRKERALRARFGQLLHEQYAREGINHLLGDLGLDILKESSSVELLHIARPISKSLLPRVEGSAVTTGMVLEPEIAYRAVCSLLDPRNHGFVNAGDDPDPQIGLRFRKDHSTLDILISLEGSRPGSPHQDVWVEIHDETGKPVHFAGPHCMNDPIFQKLAEALLKR